LEYEKSVKDSASVWKSCCNLKFIGEKSEIKGTDKFGGTIVDTNLQYTQSKYDEIKNRSQREETLIAWRNDHAVSELVLWTGSSDVQSMTIIVSDFISGANKILAKNVTVSFIKSTKAYNGDYLGYGDKNRKIPKETQDNRSEAFDILYQTDSFYMKAGKIQPVWVDIYVPKDTKADVYMGTLTVKDDKDNRIVFTYKLNIQDIVLLDSTEFKNSFDIELWQYPYSSAEYYDVKPFSEEHFSLIKSSMIKYREIGGHAITASIVEEAWNGQTYSKKEVHYPSMIKWIKNVDGKFIYDYSDFDRWVEFNKKLGIGDKIVLYSIAPWHNSFSYWEEDVLKYEVFTVGNARYKEVWKDFLEKLIDHLMDKDWFEEAYIGIDERGFCTEAFELIDSVRNIYGKSLKTAGAIDRFVDKKEFALQITDLNVSDTAAAAYPTKFQELLAKRKAFGFRTILYSCTEHEPGNFVLSAPVESYWSMINAGKADTAGFLRWAYDAWVKDPLKDATHNAFEPGDCFLIYPDEKDVQHKVSKSSIRLEKMAEGVRDVNKLMMMKNEIPNLEDKVKAVYDKITIIPTTSRSYLSESKRMQLSLEVKCFKEALYMLSEEYMKIIKKAVERADFGKELNIGNKLPTYELNEKYLSDIDKDESNENGRRYLGQPDMVMLDDNKTLITAYPKGHGKGSLIMKISYNAGETWVEKVNTPKSWRGSQETPTMYKLHLADGTQRIILITACPGWGMDLAGNRYGWNTSYSDDGGETWTEYQHWYSKRADNQDNVVIVGMASLIQLKDKDGNDIQKWIGVYHDSDYVNYKTYLTFDEDGKEQWSIPEAYLREYRDIERIYQMCEIGMFRSPDGKRIVGLARSQSHHNPATLIYSDDEGENWSKPMDLPGSLAGERHKALYDPVSNRLFIAFREILYDQNGNNQFDGSWTAGDWGAWVGTYEDLINQKEGQYRIILDRDWTNSVYSGDTGYTGMAVQPDGTFILDTYGHWDKDFSMSWTGGVTTDLCYIRQAKFKLSDFEAENNITML
jgi:hypothetical protein